MPFTTRAQVIGSVITEAVTDGTLAAAKAGDRDAGASILCQLEGRLTALARSAASRAAAGTTDVQAASHTEDLTQEAMLIVWECLTGYEGDSVDDFRAYTFRYVEKELPARARDLLNGTEDDTDGKKLFAQMVKHFRAADANHTMTEGDYVNLAEAAVQDKSLVRTLNGGAYKSRVRMSPEAAAAARLAYQGAVSISVPVGGEDSEVTLGDTLTAMLSVVDAADDTQSGYRPIQWTQAVRALEDSLSAPRDSATRQAVFTALDRFRAGTVTDDDLELMESLPCRSAAVGTAVAMLRALHTQRGETPQPSTADKSADAALGRGSIALSAQRAVLEKATDDAVKRALVRRVIATLSQRQGYILAATFGFMGKFKDDAAVARAMKAAGIADIAPERVRKDRDKARAAFATKWAALMAKSGGDRMALEMAAAMQGVDLTEALSED